MFSIHISGRYNSRPVTSERTHAWVARFIILSNVNIGWTQKPSETKKFTLDAIAFDLQYNVIIVIIV